MKSMKYVGIIEVDAEPCSRAGAKLRNAKVQKGGKDTDEGYLLKHKDGTRKWLESDLFESSFISAADTPLAASAPMMVSNDYQERFVAEYKQLEYRSEKLRLMVEMMEHKPARLWSFMPACPVEAFKLQLEYMDHYMAILKMRASIENIMIK